MPLSKLKSRMPCISDINGKDTRNHRFRQTPPEYHPTGTGHWFGKTPSRKTRGFAFYSYGEYLFSVSSWTFHQKANKGPSCPSIVLSAVTLFVSSSPKRALPRWRRSPPRLAHGSPTLPRRTSREPGLKRPFVLLVPRNFEPRDSRNAKFRINDPVSCPSGDL